ncbi:hypothetical protein [Novosphingobium sp. AP12]|uniref:hypothetical protein n=1 Tax=Novosphingobium sp. AP12 TaxID=1144305 RepID=UPI0012FC30AD|nr:hypothetical protein [Novosphingobium sp. AP12]
MADAAGRRTAVVGTVIPAVLIEGRWQEYGNSYAPPIELCSGHDPFVLPLGNKENGPLFDDVEHKGLPEI